MEAADVLKVFQFARFDIATCGTIWASRAAPIFCTKNRQCWLEPIPTVTPKISLVQEPEQVEPTRAPEF